MKLILWGTADGADRFFEFTEPVIRDKNVEIVGVVDDKYTGYYRGYKIMTPDECDNYDIDYILYIESSCGLDISGVNSCVSEKNKGKVIGIISFIELVGRNLKFEKASAVFFGSKESYDARFIGMENLFKKAKFISNNHGNENLQLLKEADMIFISNEWYKSEDDMCDYERKIIRYLLKIGVKREKIYSHSWAEYLSSRIIKCKTEGSLNPDKKFLVFHPRRFVGIALHYGDVLEAIGYAEKNDMIPVVDMKNFPNIYLPKDIQDGVRNGSENPWEWFFEKVSEYDLDEVWNSKNVYLYPLYSGVRIPAKFDRILLKQNVKTNIEKEYNKLFPKDSDRVLGVIYRGTDYYSAALHPIPLTPEEFMDRVEEIMKEKNFQYIFLATEVQDITEAFRKRFGDKVFFTDQRRFRASERQFLAKLHFDRDNDEYKKGLEYLTVLMLLRKCRGIVGATCGAFEFAIQDNEELEYIERMNKDPKATRYITFPIFIRKCCRMAKRKLQICQYRKAY